jgi:hypothetical protein
MRLRLSRPAITSDERVLFEAAAITFRGWRTITGTVTVTTERLLFTPNRLDELTGVPAISVPRAQISGVSLAPSGSAALRERGIAAALRPQVCIEHPDGPTFLSVSGAESLLAALDDAAG